MKQLSCFIRSGADSSDICIEIYIKLVKCCEIFWKGLSCIAIYSLSLFHCLLCGEWFSLEALPLRFIFFGTGMRRKKGERKAYAAFYPGLRNRSSVCLRLMPASPHWEHRTMVLNIVTEKCILGMFYKQLSPRATENKQETKTKK